MKTFSFFAFLLSLAACKKTDTTQPTSTCTIGKDSFTSNQVFLETGGHQGTSLKVGSNSAFFSYTSILMTLPYNREYRFNKTGTVNPAYLNIAFVLNDATYDPVDSDLVQISRTNGIFTMEIQSAPFRNYADPTDVRQVKATIRVRAN